MDRKKWTPSLEITAPLLKLREKKKWQLALRRYVIEKNISAGYAFYFGLTIEDFRNWISIQFIEGLSWDNFGTAWQFEHIIPLAYFDFEKEEDLLLCWNFINIRVQRIDGLESMNNISLIAAKPYFESLNKKTSFPACEKMIDKINILQTASIITQPAIEDFIIKNKARILIQSSLEKEAFNRLNTGTTLEDILKEIELFKKFG